MIAVSAVSDWLKRQEQSIEAYDRAVQIKPEEGRLSMSNGHLNKTLGRRQDSEAAYKAALAMDPRHAEAYWSLADLKNYSFGDGEIAAMERLLTSAAAERSNASLLHFALGKALEQRQQYAHSFTHYARGNALRRLDAPFDIGHFERRTVRICTFFNAEFIARHAGRGNPGAAPIFIVGLPRSGSTLVEQTSPATRVWKARWSCPISSP